MGLSILRKKNNTVKDEISRVREEYSSQVRMISNMLVSRNDVTWRTFSSLLDDFIRTIYNIPASENDHNSRGWGLLEHTLDVIIRSLSLESRKLQTFYDDKGNLDSQRMVMNKERALLATAIRGLYHDIGKIFDMVIKYKAETYDPLKEKLLDFYIRTGAIEDITMVDITWIKNRSNQHEHRSIMYLFDNVDQSIRNYLGAYNFLKIVDDFIPFNTRTDIVSMADVIAAEKETDEDSMEKISIIDKFLESLEEMIVSGQLTFNMQNSLVYTTFAHTLLHVEKGTNLVLKHMRKKYGKGHTTKTNSLISILKEYGIIELNEGGQTIHQAKISRVNREISVIAIRNSRLWKNSTPIDTDIKIEVPAIGIYFPESDKAEHVPDLFVKETSEPAISRDAILEKRVKEEVEEEIEKEVSGQEISDLSEPGIPDVEETGLDDMPFPDDPMDDPYEDREVQENENTAESKNSEVSEETSEISSNEGLEISGNVPIYEKIKYNIIRALPNMKNATDAEGGEIEYFYRSGLLGITIPRGIRKIIYINKEWKKRCKNDPGEFDRLLQRIVESMQTTEMLFNSNNPVEKATIGNHIYDVFLFKIDMLGEELKKLPPGVLEEYPEKIEIKA